MHVQLENVGKRFGDISALEDLTLGIDAGNIVALVGTNGAGKSTLLRLLSAINVPTSGNIWLDGERLERGRLDLRRRLALLPDMPPVDGRTTPIAYVSSLVGLYDAARPGLEDFVVSLFDELDLLPVVDAHVSTLSRGQTYKTGLAALIAVDPDLWLFDEPFASGMDPQGLAVFRKYAQKAAGRGKTVIYSTQILELAEQFADKIAILSGGRLHAFGSVEELREAGAIEGDEVLGRIFAGLHTANR
jgi:ABC-type multidrug transport system ATPase subunit